MFIRNATTKNGALAAFTSLAVLVMPGAQDANAQNNSYQQGGGAKQQMQKQRQQVNVSDAQLEKFVKAQNNLRELRAQNKQGNTSREQARQQMMKAIKDSGLGLREYNKINKAVRSNAELRKKYQQMAQ